MPETLHHYKVYDHSYMPQVR